MVGAIFAWISPALRLFLLSRPPMGNKECRVCFSFTGSPETKAEVIRSLVATRRFRRQSRAAIRRRGKCDGCRDESSMFNHPCQYQRDPLCVFPPNKRHDTTGLLTRPCCAHNSPRLKTKQISVVMEEQPPPFPRNKERLAPVHLGLPAPYSFITLSGQTLRGWPRLGTVPVAPLTGAHRY